MVSSSAAGVSLLATSTAWRAANPCKTSSCARGCRRVAEFDLSRQLTEKYLHPSIRKPSLEDDPRVHGGCPGFEWVAHRHVRHDDRQGRMPNCAASSISNATCRPVKTLPTTRKPSRGGPGHQGPTHPRSL